MSKIEKGIGLLFTIVIGIVLIPAILPMLVGEASWILVPVLILFLIIFPLLLLFKKSD